MSRSLLGVYIGAAATEMNLMPATALSSGTLVRCLGFRFQGLWYVVCINPGYPKLAPKCRMGSPQQVPLILGNHHIHQNDVTLLGSIVVKSVSCFVNGSGGHRQHYENQPKRDNQNPSDNATNCDARWQYSSFRKRWDPNIDPNIY